MVGRQNTGQGQLFRPGLLYSHLQMLRVFLYVQVHYMHVLNAQSGADFSLNLDLVPCSFSRNRNPTIT
jgi:hypothetical protein